MQAVLSQHYWGVYASNTPYLFPFLIICGQNLNISLLVLLIVIF
jgi:hypothetical protein